MEHLSWVELISFGDPSLKDKEREPVATHMRTCSACRDYYISIQSFRSALKQAPPQFVPFVLTNDCIPEEILGDFMGSRLPSSEQKAFSSHMTHCDICFERAAYLTWSGARMTEGLLNMEPTPDRFKEAVTNRHPAKPEEKREPFSIWDFVRRWIASPVPAYAFAASIVFFLLVGTFRLQEDVVLLTGDKLFTLYEQPSHSGSSFGFSDAGRKVSEVEADLLVNREDDGRFWFSWNAVQGASGYKFHLTEVALAGETSMVDTQTELTEVYTAADILSPGSVYRWKVTGTTQTGEFFVAQGQFALPN